jgi:hypothetical protein
MPLEDIIEKRVNIEANSNWQYLIWSSLCKWQITCWYRPKIVLKEKMSWFFKKILELKVYKIEKGDFCKKSEYNKL